VAQISKTICLMINHRRLNGERDEKIEPDLCEFAGLAHDLGHPPFGHQGEEALDECMRDFGGFEGNAQTFRILTKIEKKQKNMEQAVGVDFRYGLNLTYRSIASILKYDNAIPFTKADRPEDQQGNAIKGYYAIDDELIKTIKNNVAPGFDGKFKTVECKIMDIADDIAYSTYDLEDGFKAGFYHPTVFFSYQDSVFENVAKKVVKALLKDEHCDRKNFSAADVKEELFGLFSGIYNFDDALKSEEGGKYSLNLKEGQSEQALLGDMVNTILRTSKNVAEDGYLRNAYTSALVNSAIEEVVFDLNDKFPALSDVYLSENARIRVEVLKNFTYESQINSPRLKVAEFRGKEIVTTIFEVLRADEGWRLMPYDYQELYQHFTEQQDKVRTICDFIAGMTDRYAIEFYGRLKSENPETIFKPL